MLVVNESCRKSYMNNTTPAHWDKVTDGGNYYSGLIFFQCNFPSEWICNRSQREGRNVRKLAVWFGLHWKFLCLSAKGANSNMTLKILAFKQLFCEIIMTWSSEIRFRYQSITVCLKYLIHGYWGPNEKENKELCWFINQGHPTRM